MVADCLLCNFAAGRAGGQEAPQLAHQEDQGQAGALQRAPIGFPQLLTRLSGKACSIYMHLHPSRHRHTGAACTALQGETLQNPIGRNSGSYVVQGVDLSNYNFLGIGPTAADLDESVKEDVHKLRASPLIPKQVPIYGFVYDVKVCSHARTWVPCPMTNLVQIFHHHALVHVAGSSCAICSSSGHHQTAYTVNWNTQDILSALIGWHIIRIYIYHHIFRGFFCQPAVIWSAEHDRCHQASS